VKKWVNGRGYEKGNVVFYGDALWTAQQNVSKGNVPREDYINWIKAKYRGYWSTGSDYNTGDIVKTDDDYGRHWKALEQHKSSNGDKLGKTSPWILYPSMGVELLKFSPPGVKDDTSGMLHNNTLAVKDGRALAIVMVAISPESQYDVKHSAPLWDGDLLKALRECVGVDKIDSIHFRKIITKLYSNWETFNNKIQERYPKKYEHEYEYERKLGKLQWMALKKDINHIMGDEWKPRHINI